MRERINGQLMRDFVLCVMLAIAVLLYDTALRLYLLELDQPLFLEIGFLTSLAIACLYEFKVGAQWRYALVGCLINALVFLCGAWVARGFRHEYLGLVEFLKGNIEISAWLGHDLHAALTTRYVGYAGCFAGGLLFARLTVGNGKVRSLLRLAFVLQGNGPNLCPCCGQPIASKAAETTGVPT